MVIEEDTRKFQYISTLSTSRILILFSKDIPGVPICVPSYPYRKEEQEVEKILNKRTVKEKEKFLVWWKGFIMEADTWKERENLENTKEVLILGDQQ